MCGMCLHIFMCVVYVYMHASVCCMLIGMHVCGVCLYVCMCVLYAYRYACVCMCTHALMPMNILKPEEAISTQHSPPYSLTESGARLATHKPQ